MPVNKFGIVSKTRPIGEDAQGRPVWMDRYGRIATRPRPEKCEICGCSGKICFDHCHDYEIFRGWICNRCNTALGMVRDSRVVLERMAEYLDAFCTSPHYLDAVRQRFDSQV